MTITRRLLLNMISFSPLLPHLSFAESIMERIPERSFGDNSAPLVITEWFSFTCIHCAHFNKEVFPEIKKNLIDTGKIRYVFKDMPMDKLGLYAALISRRLPKDKYLAFVDTLLNTQESWAFGANEADPLSKLRQQSIMAGLSTTEFDEIINDKEIRDILIKQTEADQNQYGLTGTPSFLFPSNKIKSGALTYDEFIKNLSSIA